MPAPPALTLAPSARAGKKWVVRAEGWGAVHFGALGYSDYTLHRDPARKARYILRHRARETWGVAGAKTAGFWARWILWNLPTLRASVRDVNRRFPSLRVTLADT